MTCKNKLIMTKKKAFTLIELLIVIAIIGILFIVLVSKVDFATDKAKATGVQTDFRSFQVAFDTVAKENAGFNTFGWDTGDANQDGIRNSYDEGDNGAGGGIAKNGIQDGTEVFTGHKVYDETFTKIYSLKKAKADGTLEDNYDRDALNRLETAINANLDPKLHITIKDDGEIVMANGAKDPWNKEYHGYYITNAETDKQDRGAIIMYSDGANNEFGSEHKISNGVVTISLPGNNKYGKDDYSIVSLYTYVNGYGEVKNITTGFSNNQTMLAGNNSVLVTPNIPDIPNEPIQPDDPNLPVNGVYEMLDGANQTFDAEAPVDLTFRSKADFNKFSDVKVDGVSVSSIHYAISEGSTIITLKADYLKTLDAGEHDVEIVSNDGVAYANFNCIPKRTLVSFTIDNITYQADENMTFGAWVESEYNTIGLYVFNEGLYIGDYIYISDLYGEEPHIVLQRVGGGFALTPQSVIRQNDEYYLYDSIGEWLINSFFTVNGHYFTFRVFPDSIIWADVVTSAYHCPWYQTTITDDGEWTYNEEDEYFVNRIDWYIDDDPDNIKDKDIVVYNYNYEDDEPRECYLCYADGTRVKYGDSIKEILYGGDYILIEANN